MHFLLVGPGALGCLLSSVLSRGLDRGDRLTILDYNAERARRISDEGIAYHLGDSCTTVAVRAISDPAALDPVDVVLLCVKSYDVQASLQFCRPVLRPGTLLVFMQNGISHLALDNHLHEATAAFATTTEGATLLGIGQVRHAGSGITYLGFLKPAAEAAAAKLQHTSRVLAHGGLQVQLTDDILARLWAKLLVNVGINALTAILGCKNGELLTIAGADRRMDAAVGEAVRLAEAKGIRLLDDPYLTTRLVCRKTADNISSMLQDVRKKRRTEIDAINGAVVALGGELGITTPENARLCRQVKELEAGYGQR